MQTVGRVAGLEECMAAESGIGSSVANVMYKRVVVDGVDP